MMHSFTYPFRLMASQTYPLCTNVWSRVSNWMSQTFFQLNHSSTEVLVQIRSLQASSNTLVHRLWVNNPLPKTWASFLTTNFKAVIQSCYFHLKNIAWIRPLLSFPTLEKVIHAFVSSCLDYCNTFSSCLSQDTVTQLVQNSTARRLSSSSLTLWIILLQSV